MTCMRVKGGSRNIQPDCSHVFLSHCALYVSPQVIVFRYITQLCARACSRPFRRFRCSFETDLLSTDLLPFSFKVLWWASALVNACQGSICHWQLNSHNLQLLFSPSFFLIRLVCLPLQEARTELPQDEAGPVQRSVWHQRAIGWVACQQQLFQKSKMSQAGAATVWCIGRKRKQNRWGENQV